MQLQICAHGQFAWLYMVVIRRKAEAFKINFLNHTTKRLKPTGQPVGELLLLWFIMPEAEVVIGHVLVSDRHKLMGDMEPRFLGYRVEAVIE